MPAVSSLQLNKKQKNPVFIYIAAIIGIGLLVFFGGELLKSLNILKGKSAIAIDVKGQPAEVYINDQLAGNTPFESSELEPGENKITIKSSDRQYETTIKSLSDDDKYIHQVGVFRDLGVSDLFSSGQNFWFDKDNSGTVLRIISDPEGAAVLIDGVKIGDAPFTSNNLSEGDYDLKVEAPGYEPQEARIRIQKGYTSNISIKLFPLPMPTTVTEFEGSAGLYDVSTENTNVAADTFTWVKAILYWNTTRGANLEGVGPNTSLVFDYFADYRGNIFDRDGNVIKSTEDFAKLGKVEKGAYLGRLADGLGISQPAKEALAQLTNTAFGKSVKVLPTGIGYLNVRSTPETGGTLVTTVNVGEIFAVLEEGNGWTKIKIDDATEGWVINTYIEVIETETTEN